ncbi:MAG: rhodanese-like domain-containing protein [Cytophagales bacterium]|nr:MAG: rhodanese-like domain-containing protein [Cytophagales bacterium]
MLDFFKSILGGGNKVNIQEILDKGAVVIDVRTPQEYAAGHVKGSKNIPLNTISTNIEKIKAMNKPIILCCASGMRSGQATGILTKEGIEAYNAGSWQSLA